MRFEQFRMATQLIQRGFWRVAAFMVFSMAAKVGTKVVVSVWRRFIGFVVSRKLFRLIIYMLLGRILQLFYEGQMSVDQLLRSEVNTMPESVDAHLMRFTRTILLCVSMAWPSLFAR